MNNDFKTNIDLILKNISNDKHIIWKLKCFKTVYETCSLNEATKTLFRSKSTISENIKTLNKIIGTSLFEIKNKRLYPTNIGIFLYSSIQKSDIFVKQISISKNCNNITIDQNNIIKIACHPLAINNILKAIDIFKTKYQTQNCYIKFNITIENREDALRKGKYDIVIFPAENNFPNIIKKQYPNLIIEKLRPYKLVLVTHKDNKIAKLSPEEIDMKMIRQLNIMPNNNNLTFQSWNINKTHNFPHHYFDNIIANTDSMDFYTILMCIQQNLGTIITGSEIVDQFIHGNKKFKDLTIIDANRHLNYYLWFSSIKTNQKIKKIFYQLLKQIFDHT